MIAMGAGVLEKLDFSGWSQRRKVVVGAVMVVVLFGYVVQHFQPDDGNRLDFVNVLAMLGFIYFIGAFGRREGHYHQTSGDFEVADNQIFNLQRELSDAAYSQAFAERQGDHHRAAYWKGRVLELESKLRRLGA